MVQKETVLMIPSQKKRALPVFFLVIYMNLVTYYIHAAILLHSCGYQISRDTGRYVLRTIMPEIVTVIVNK